MILNVFLKKKRARGKFYVWSAANSSASLVHFSVPANVFMKQWIINLTDPKSITCQPAAVSQTFSSAGPTGLTGNTLHLYLLLWVQSLCRGFLPQIFLCFPSSSVQLACAQFQRTFSGFAFCPFGLQLLSPLLPLLLGQLGLTETWWTIKTSRAVKRTRILSHHCGCRRGLEKVFKN